MTDENRNSDQDEALTQEEEKLMEKILRHQRKFAYDKKNSATERRKTLKSIIQDYANKEDESG